MHNVEITPIHPLSFLSPKSLNPLCGKLNGPHLNMEYPFKYAHWLF
jgi:hypothetical protein